MSLIEWPKAIVEYAGFLAAYSTIGDDAAARAAWIGVGVLVSLPSPKLP
jgi:hypothetical protein